jgi:hypothetical protein
MDLPGGWEKDRDLSAYSLLMLIPAGLLLGGVSYNLALGNFDLGWLFLLFVALLVTFAATMSILSVWRFKGSCHRDFRLKEYERLSLEGGLNAFREDLLADLMGARKGGASMVEYYVLGQDPRTLLGVTYLSDFPGFTVRFILTPGAFDYSRQVERFAKGNGWDGN